MFESKSEEGKGRPKHRMRTFPWRFILYAGVILALLIASAWTISTIRSCAAGMEAAFRTETITRIYEHGASLSRDARIVLARKKSGFVIPKDIIRKLILGLSSTATVQISCEAEILYCIDVDELLSADVSWEGQELRLALPRPEALRPLIETSTIRRAILDRGFLVNERAELDKLLAELSDLVAASPDAGLDDATLETCRSSLEAICAQAVASMGQGVVTVTVRWKAEEAGE